MPLSVEFKVAAQLVLKQQHLSSRSCFLASPSLQRVRFAFLFLVVGQRAHVSCVLLVIISGFQVLFVGADELLDSLDAYLLDGALVHNGAL